MFFRHTSNLGLASRISFRFTEVRREGGRQGATKHPSLIPPSIPNPARILMTITTRCLSLNDRTRDTASQDWEPPLRRRRTPLSSQPLPHVKSATLWPHIHCDSVDCGIIHNWTSPTHSRSSCSIVQANIFAAIMRMFMRLMRNISLSSSEHSRRRIAYHFPVPTSHKSFHDDQIQK